MVRTCISHTVQMFYLRHEQRAGVDDVYEVSQTTEEWTLEETAWKLVNTL